MKKLYNLCFLDTPYTVLVNKEKYYQAQSYNISVCVTFDLCMTFDLSPYECDLMLCHWSGTEIYQNLEIQPESP